MSRLRDPKRGCPWDLEQDHKSLKIYLLEEAHELVEAIDTGVDAKIREELGDLLLQIVFHSEMASQRAAFDFGDVAAGIAAKLIRRHPHVFGTVQVKNSREVLKNWEEIKKTEAGRRSIFDGVPKNLPALLRAYRLQEKASVVGFDWNAAHEVAEKVREEIEEFLEVSRVNDRAKMEDEYGDILFSLVNLGRFLGLNGEFSLDAANRKFMERFSAIEDEARRRGVAVASMTLEEMDRLWDDVKAAGKRSSRSKQPPTPKPKPEAKPEQPRVPKAKPKARPEQPRVPKAEPKGPGKR